MKVKWQDFAKRRKLVIEDFAHMSYSEYTVWCSVRRVEPVPQALFPVSKEENPKPIIIVQVMPEAQVEAQVIEEIEEVVTLESQEFSFKSLFKMRKSLVQGICDDNLIDYSVTSTKKQLVQKILELNNED